MKISLCRVLTLMIAGVSWAALAGNVLAQTGDGSGSGVPGLRAEGSGAATDAAKGTDHLRGTLILGP
jgi:hypothetical protein